MFGVYTKTSAIVLLSLNALMSALVCVVVLLIARISFDERVAKWSGWSWAFCPYGIYFPVEASGKRGWRTAPMFAFPDHAEFGRRREVYKWVVFGMLWGVEALTSPAVLSVLPFLLGGSSIGVIAVDAAGLPSMSLLRSRSLQSSHPGSCVIMKSFTVYPFPRWHGTGSPPWHQGQYGLLGPLRAWPLA